MAPTATASPAEGSSDGIKEESQTEAPAPALPPPISDMPQIPAVPPLLNNMDDKYNPQTYIPQFSYPMPPPASAQETLDQILRSNEGQSTKNFPEQLFDVVSDPKSDDIVAWLPHGRGFMIIDKTKFAEVLLPTYFEGAKFTSFTRRLKRWKFVRVPRGPEIGAYYNPKFVRDNPRLLEQMMYGSDDQYHQSDAPKNTGTSPRMKKAEKRKAEENELLKQLDGNPQYPMYLNLMNNMNPMGYPPLALPSTSSKRGKKAGNMPTLCHTNEQSMMTQAFYPGMMQGGMMPYPGMMPPQPYPGMMMQYPGMMGGMPHNGMGPGMFGSDQQASSYDGTPAHELHSPSAAAKGGIPGEESLKKPAMMSKEEEEDGSGKDQTSQENNPESETKSEVTI